MADEGHRRGYQAGKPWQVQIDVYLDDDSMPNPKFRVESCLESYEAGPNDKYLVFRNNCRPGFEIVFQLHDLTGKGYTFPKNAGDAIWSKVGTDCPGSDWGKNEVFTPIRVVEPDQMSLVVMNDNKARENGDPIGQFRYTLNVGRNGAKPYLPLDPGGDDQNGIRTYTLTR